MEPLRTARHVHDLLNGNPSRPDGPPARTAGTPYPLPVVDLPDAALDDVLHRRRSGYALGGPVSVQELAALLSASAGVGRRVAAHGRPDHPLTLSPTAGGLRSVEAYVAVRDVTGVPTGIHRYDLESHALVPIRTGDPTGALRAVLSQHEFAERGAAVLALVGRLDVAFSRYPLRHYRTVHVDAGIAVQSLYLTATALGLSGCAVAGYADAACDEMLGLGPESVTLMLFVAGRPGRPAAP